MNLRIRYREISWWYWCVSVILLLFGVLGIRQALYLAIVVSIVQTMHYAFREGNFSGFPVQLRMIYLGLLVMGLWYPLRWIHWIQLAGTSTVVLTGYCLLARLLSLMPWNRREAFTLDLVKRTLFSKPVEGSILHQV